MAPAAAAVAWNWPGPSWTSWSGAPCDPRGSQGFAEGVGPVVEAIGHAQAHHAVRQTVVGVAGLGLQTAVAVDDGETGSGARCAARVDGGNVEGGVAQGVFVRDRTGVIDFDDDPTGSVEADGVLA